MNLKPILRYQLRGHFQVFRVVYGVVYCIMIAAVVSHYFLPTALKNSSAQNMDFTTLITIFIVGLVFFKESFRMFTSYSVSRKRLFTGMIASLGITSAATALLDCINALIFSQFVDYRTIYTVLLNPQYMESEMRVKASAGISTGEVLSRVSYTPQLLLRNVLWCFLAYFAFALIGLFITALYYRMNKLQKALVSVCVPVFLFIGLPVLNEYVVHGMIGAALSNLFSWWMSCALNPVTDFATRGAFIAIFIGITYFIVRKAEIRA